MKNRILRLILFGAILGGVLSIPSAVQAKKAYSWTIMDAPLIYYTKPNARGYIWNYQHTKKLHNVKNYRYTTWSVTNAFTRKSKGKTSVYYKVYSANKRIKGLVWSGYLTKAVATPLDKFTTDSQYLSYINSNPSQRLTKALLKLFPNSSVSLSLSNSVEAITASKPIQNPNFTDFLSFSDLKDPQNDDIHQNGSIRETLYNSSGLAITPRVDKVAQILDVNGYTAAKRASMSNY